MDRQTNKQSKSNGQRRFRFKKPRYLNPNPNSTPKKVKFLSGLLFQMVINFLAKWMTWLVSFRNEQGDSETGDHKHRAYGQVAQRHTGA